LGPYSRHPFKYYFEFSRDEDPSKPFEQVVIDGSGRARRRAVFGDEGDWDQDDDTVDMSDDEEEKNGASTDDGVSDDDGEDMEKFEIGDKDDADNNSDTGSDVKDVVLRDEDGQSFEGESDDNEDDDDDDDNDYNFEEVDVDNAEEEEEGEEIEGEEDEEIVFNLKSQKHTGKQNLSKKQITPIERTKKSKLSNKSEDDSEEESNEDDEMESEEERNGKLNKHSVEHSDSESEVQFKKGKRKLKHDLNEGNIDDRRVKKKLKKETHSLEHKPIKDLLSSRKNGAKPKSTKGIGCERSKDTSEKKSSTQSKVKDGKELVESTDDSGESEGMEDMDEEFDDEDDAGREESSLASEEGIALMNCIVRSDIQTGFSDICVCSLTQPL